MERNAHYAAVGLATVTLMVALAVFVVWLARFSFNEEYDVYDVLFTDPVRGLSVGACIRVSACACPSVRPRPGPGSSSCVLT